MKPAKHLLGPDGTCSPGCFACKVQTVSFAPSAMPTRSPEAARAVRTDPQLDADREAYRRLRRDGQQPKSVKGSAELESRASEPWEVMTGHVESDPEVRRQTQQAFDEAPAPSGRPMVRDPA